MQWPVLPEGERVARMEPPTAYPVPVVIDSDTYNEIDDQFCIAYAALSPKVDLQAVYAAPFVNARADTPEQGMERSYEEMLRLMALLERDPTGFCFRGSDRYLGGWDTPVDSPAARDLIARAMAQPEEEPLYVLTIGCPTNVASALLMEPRLVRKIVVVWMGGNAVGWPTAREFNLMQDLPADRVLLDSGVPFVMIPAYPVLTHLATSLPELEYYLGDSTPLGQFLLANVADYRQSDARYPVYSKIIWDPATVAWCVLPEAAPSRLIPTPYLDEDMHWAVDPTRRLMREVAYIDRDPIFQDLFSLLGSAKL